MMRLDKYLSIFKIGTRSEIHKIIKNKKVKVNDEIITKPDYQINEEKEWQVYQVIKKSNIKYDPENGILTWIMWGALAYAIISFLIK